MNPTLIGKFISEQRKKHHMTQSELATLLSVTNQAISKWENGRGIPDIEMLKKLSEIFKVNINDILDGKKNQSQKFKKYFYIFIIILTILSLTLFLINSQKNTFNFYTLASDNNAFTIKGVIAYNKNKKSIYISEINYALEDEEKYKSIECLLLEVNDGLEKRIGVWGNIKNINKEAPLSELLKDVLFSVDDYDCNCTNYKCNNLYLRISVLNLNDKMITYNIPLEIDENCNL